MVGFPCQNLVHPSTGHRVFRLLGLPLCASSPASLNLNPFIRSHVIFAAESEIALKFVSLKNVCTYNHPLSRPGPIMLFLLLIMLFPNAPVLPLLYFQPVPIMLKLCPVLVVKVSFNIAITRDYAAT